MSNETEDKCQKEVKTEDTDTTAIERVTCQIGCRE